MRGGSGTITNNGANEAAGAAAPSILVAVTCRVKSVCCATPGRIFSPANCATVSVMLPLTMVNRSPAVLLSVTPPGNPEIVTGPSVSGAGPLVSVSAMVMESGIG